MGNPYTKAVGGLFANLRPVTEHTFIYFAWLVPIVFIILHFIMFYIKILIKLMQIHTFTVDQFVNCVNFNNNKKILNIVDSCSCFYTKPAF